MAKITPYKGGRSERVYARMTKKAKARLLARVKSEGYKSLADWLEAQATQDRKAVAKSGGDSERKGMTMVDDNAINPETGETIYVGILEKLPAGFRWIHDMKTDEEWLEVIRLRHRRVAELEAALKPFAHEDLCRNFTHNVNGDDSPVFERNNAMLTLGDFRRARALLK